MATPFINPRTIKVRFLKIEGYSIKEKYNIKSIVVKINDKVAQNRVLPISLILLNCIDKLGVIEIIINAIVSWKIEIPRITKLNKI
jgi:hypothetical protein